MSGLRRARQDGSAVLIDSSPAFLLRGYRYIGERCDRAGRDIAEARLLLRRTVLLRGAKAARLLYDQELFSRNGGLPLRAQRTLTRRGGVQSLDGTEHRARKALFMRLLDDAAVDEVVRRFRAELERRFPEWERDGSVRLLDACSEALCVAASGWVGLPAEPAEIVARTRALRAMIESGARLGPAHWAGLAARWTAERALARTIERVRELPASTTGTPLEVVALHADEHGNRLPARIAAVELLNLLRPIVAIARYVAFAVHALATEPGVRDFVGAGGERETESFANEVRRFYPFFPAVAAVARTDVDFESRRIAKGRRVLLDLWGTNRGADQADPDRFDPARFLAPMPPFSFIPQGGGDVATGHRCPGEGMTVAVIAAAVDQLTAGLDFTVEPARVSLRRIPTEPSAGLRLTALRRRAGGGAEVAGA